MANEKRLIDANAYCKELYKERDYPGRTQEFMDTIEVAIADLSDMPTVDAVEVVRCKDCKYFVNGDTCFNDQWWNDDFFTYVKEDDFCSYGERKDNG